MSLQYELVEEDFLPRISQEYEDGETLWGVDYWSVWEEYNREEYERKEYERKD